ncbi:concanavalin A-like lectin/glucanase [Tilletiaria anomala UBC 951]|uniref:Concanavalin A-like lectin/glucanase n=1 Tax=Tilletiaria anomala (strain ATCC 24038 / CBS 436.72 / UBC 951) TaxID=1037660 RepID=A0A066W2H2_TILAU|nr:concanavalin A-like lectin/glucanase [Tilletiaria anomala UBC 951]KDN48177.1 concanavalin A-like lectin/glucanase [Tilletiaria anomala UBC 951]
MLASACPCLMRLLASAALLLWTTSIVPVLAQSASRSQELASDALVPIRTHSIAAPYVDSNLQNKFWDFGGDTIVDTSRAVRLTQDKPSQTGWLWSRSTLSPVNYQIIIEFKIDGHNPHLFGDGFAMWLTTERALTGPVFGSKNHFTGVGIIFDTYANTRHAYSFPRVMAVSGNGIDAYVTAQDGANLEVGGCSVDIRRAAVATKAKLTYVKSAYLELQLQYNDWDEWETCFNLENIAIPEHPFLGFTALTGDVSDNHDIISVETHTIVAKPKTSPQMRADREASKSKAEGRKQRHPSSSNVSGGFFAFLFSFIFTLIKWAIIIGAVGTAVMFGLRYKKKQDAKRF